MSKHAGKHLNKAFRSPGSRADQIHELMHRHPDAMKTVNVFTLPGMNRKEKRKLAKKLKEKT
jgi:hypothetical protein